MIHARMTVSSDATIDAVLAGAVSRCLGIPAEAIAPDTSLSLLGLDSLAAVELAADLETTLGRPVPENLLEDCNDLRAVADRLREVPSRSRASADPCDRMVADAVLPDGLRPRRAAGPSTSLRAARAILLTGATGFLGSWLARELLLTTNATVYCLVRQKGGLSARERLWSALQAAGVETATSPPRDWRQDTSPAPARHARSSRPAHRARIAVVEADLSCPRLGLTHADYRALAGSVDAICHAGAVVNWVYSYDGLRGANVLGTLELLRLACHDRPLPFHFVSSLSVCCSMTGARQVDESLDPLGEIRGIHLGYAQTKAVAEALALEAGRRGLPVRVYRPGLIAGHSVTGAFNRDDLLSALVRGCLRMGSAPDLDWSLDCQPVDWLARAVVHLSGSTGPVFHLAHPCPRHWRECVLWMRLYGYPLSLVPYHAWLRQLDTETSSCAAHPLRPLRQFFLEARSNIGGLTLPQLYEECRRPRVRQERTESALGGLRRECPALDAALLETYFAAFRAAGELAPPSDPDACERSSRPASDLRLARRVRPPGEAAAEVTELGPLEPLRGSGSIIGELTSWRSNRPIGLFSTEVKLSDARRRPAIVKIKARDEDAIAVGEALAHLCDAAVGRMYSRWRDRVGLTASHLRELAIYSQTDPRFVRHAPRVLGIICDSSSATWLVALERIDAAIARECEGRQAVWDDRAIDAVIEGLAALHSIWYGREGELSSRDWIGHTPSTRSMVQMEGLWTALAAHAAPAFASWAGPIATIQQRLITRIDEWWPALEQPPRTLIHNDFTPRNICVRERDGDLTLCAYDWELATIGAPQRDLVEFLCFILPPDTPGDAVDRWVAHHRRSVEQYAGVRIDARRWRQGFSAAVYDMLINRLGMYALIHRVRRQAFLPGVVRTWRRLYELYPLEGTR